MIKTKRPVLYLFKCLKMREVALRYYNKYVYHFLTFYARGSRARRGVTPLYREKLRKGGCALWRCIQNGI